MNYWVISPNARNDGNIKKYLNIIEKTHKVLIGWSETDNLGKTFKKDIKIGDLILIAQGSNKNKKVYFVGLVDSDAITEKLEIDNDIFEGQNRLLKYFTKLEDFQFDFENCAYGHSNQIPAIYKLKPNENKCDKKLTKKLKKKIKNIKKGVKYENIEEKLKVRKILKEFFENLQKENEFLKNYKISINQAPTQQFWSEENGFRVGFYKGESYKDSTQINLTIGASWGGGVFIKDNENLIFGNKKLLKKVKKKYPDFDFNKENQTIWALFFENNNKKIHKKKKILKTIKKLDKIYKMALKDKK
jgi:hypothetical protein